MNVGQVILRRPLLFDKNIYGRSKMCQFEHEGKNVILPPSRPKVGQPKETPIAPKKTKRINLISAEAFNQELRRGTLFLILTARKVMEKSDSTISPKVTLVIKEFSVSSRKSPGQIATNA